WRQEILKLLNENFVVHRDATSEESQRRSREFAFFRYRLDTSTKMAIEMTPPRFGAEWRTSYWRRALPELPPERSIAPYLKSHDFSYDQERINKHFVAQHIT